MTLKQGDPHARSAQSQSAGKPCNPGANDGDMWAAVADRELHAVLSLVLGFAQLLTHPINLSSMVYTLVSRKCYTFSA